MIGKLLGQENIVLGVETSNWEEAVRIGGELLVNTGKVEQEYVEAMIDSAKELGPYYVMVPGIAMPHARSEAGVLDRGLSLITLKNPVDFLTSPNNPVSIVMCFSAADVEEHLEVMKSLAMFLDNQEDIKELEKANTVEKALEIMNKY